MLLKYLQFIRVELNSNEFIEFVLKMIDETASELLISTTQGKIERIGSPKSGTWIVK